MTVSPEPRAVDCFKMSSIDKEALHATVTATVANNEIHYAGYGRETKSVDKKTHSKIDVMHSDVQQFLRVLFFFRPISYV